MKLTSRLVVGALLLAGPAAFSADTATANATATILTAIALTNNTGLAFGSIVPHTSLSTVIVSAAGVRSIGSGTPTLVSGTTSAASFTATGTGSQTYTITLPGTASTLTSGANTMTVDTLTSSLGATGTLTGGTQNFSVGGTLNVGASQAAGSYTGTFDVTVAYN